MAQEGWAPCGKDLGQQDHGGGVGGSSCQLALLKEDLEALRRGAWSRASVDGAGGGRSLEGLTLARLSVPKGPHAVQGARSRPRDPERWEGEGGDAQALQRGFLEGTGRGPLRRRRRGQAMGVGWAEVGEGPEQGGHRWAQGTPRGVGRWERGRGAGGLERRGVGGGAGGPGRG